MCQKFYNIGMMREQNQKRVLIIGAGLSGLTAADQILKSQPKAQVTVLQAMDEVGGRTKSVKIKDTVYDLGAQWVGPPQKYAIELAQRSQNELIHQFHTGTKILEFEKKKHKYLSDIPRGVGILQLVHLQVSLWKIDGMAKKVPKENPLQCPHAQVWDTMTVHTWVRQNIWFEDIRKLFEMSIRAIIGCETNEISLLFFLWYVHQNHGIQCLINIDNGLQEKKMKYGTQHMSLYLKKEIQKRDGLILLNRFVSKVIQRQEECIVQTRNQELFEADYVIFAGPPPAANKIQFCPPLSRDRRLVCSRYNMGAYSKMVLLYPQQFWKDKGYSGQVLSDCHDSPVFMTYDDSRTNSEGVLQPGIVVFFAGGIDEEWTGDKENCMKVVTEKLANHFQCPELLAPLSYELKVWNNEESIGGAPTGYLPPGVLTKIHNLRGPEGRIHWAGTELANVSQGYMDGAIQSGIRVSKEIISRFQGQTTQQRREKQRPISTWYKSIINASIKWFEWW